MNPQNTKRYCSNECYFVGLNLAQKSYLQSLVHEEPSTSDSSLSTSTDCEQVEKILDLVPKEFLICAREGCEEKFLKKGTQKCCGKACAKLFDAAQKRKRYRLKREAGGTYVLEKQCRNCSKSFNPSRSDALYCGEECKARFYSKKRIKRKKMKLAMEKAANASNPTRSSGLVKKYKSRGKPCAGTSSLGLSLT